MHAWLEPNTLCEHHEAQLHQSPVPEGQQGGVTVMTTLTLGTLPSVLLEAGQLVTKCSSQV